MKNGKPVEEILLDFQTRLQGVANSLGAKLSELISSTDAALLQTIIKNFPRAKAGKASIRAEMKELEALVKRLEKIRSKGFDVAKNFAFQVASQTADAASKNAAGLIDVQNERNGKSEKKVKNATPLSEKTLKDIVDYEPIDGQSIRGWFQRMQEADLRNITQAVYRAASERISVAEISKVIRGTKENNYADGILQTTRSASVSIARTIINGVANNSRIETIIDNADVSDGVRFVSTLDGKTCPHCASFDNRIWGPKEMGMVRRPPLHIGCRCCVVAHVELRDKDGKIVDTGATRPAANADFDKLAEEAYNKDARNKGSERRWKDLAQSTRLKYYYQTQKDYEKRTGKPAYRQVAGTTSFKDYFVKQDAAFQRAWLGAKRYELYKAGTLKTSDIFKPSPTYGAKIADLVSAFKTLSAPKKTTPAASTAPAKVSATKDPGAFPEKLGDLTVVQSLGGSTGAKMVKDADGNLYVMKKGGGAGGDAAKHLLNECAVDKFYQSLGVNVPQFKVYEEDGGPVKLSRFIEGGRSLGDWWNDATDAERKRMRDELRAAFDVDCLTGNWDVVGASADNILVDKNGKPWRIDNGGAFGYRAQGARKAKEDWDDGWIDEFWTMTGRGRQIEKNVGSTCEKYVGSDLDVLTLATQANARDWKSALKDVPDDVRAVLLKRLEETRQLAERGGDFVSTGFTRDYANGVLDYSYLASKDGLREATAFDLKDATKHARSSQMGWWRTRTNPKSADLHKRFTSFTDYVEQRFPGSAIFMGDNNGSQAGCSYNETAIRTKLARLYAMGLDITDTKTYPDFDAVKAKATQMGYYVGDGGRSEKNFRDVYKNYIQKKKGVKTDYGRRDFDDFLGDVKKAQQYHAAIQIALENNTFHGNDKATRSVVLIRTESNSVIKINGALPNVGEECKHLRGVAESHAYASTVVVLGDNATAIRVPYSRIGGVYFAERYPQCNSSSFMGDDENEFNADTHGLPAIYCGKVQGRERAEKYLGPFKEWEKKNRKKKTK